MYQDNLLRELIIDNFAGGGGASTGIELALGQPVDIAINHNADAIAMHKVNHPYTMHYQEDVFAVVPEAVTGNRPVGVAWFSPDCTHFSRAKGNKPVEKKIRGLSWVILKWALSGVAPRIIFMENVEEIQSWGPLKEIAPGKYLPDEMRVGETFKGFISMLSKGIEKDHPALIEACEFLHIEKDTAQYQRLVDGLGYNVEYRVLRACDYGAPTIRKRFYLVARKDGQPIVFPTPTHGKDKGLKPYRTAAECIDMTKPCPSIFGRRKDLASNTLRRIARGLDKFVIKNTKPFLIQMNYENTAQDIATPLSTQTAVNKHFVVEPSVAPYVMSNNTGNVPHDIQAPIPTITTGGRNFLCVPSIVPIRHGENKGQKPRIHDIEQPLLTAVTSGKHYVCTPYITQYYGGEKQSGADIKKPLPTVTSIDHNGVVASNLMQYYGGSDQYSKTDAPLPTVTTKARNAYVSTNMCVLRNNMGAKSANEPLSTITASARHHAHVKTYILPIAGNVELYKWNEVRGLLNTYAGYNIAENEILILEINGVQHFIADVGMRMLEPEELKLAQGFPKDYVIDIESCTGKPYCKQKQIARLGNAVCPPVATALIQANCAEIALKKPCQTMERLEKIYCRTA